MAEWTFLTNHARVLLCIGRDPGQPIREIAARIGITERATQRLIRDLEEAGYIERRREGRRNRYKVRPDRPFRHPLEKDHRIGELIELLNSD